MLAAVACCTAAEHHPTCVLLAAADAGEAAAGSGGIKLLQGMDDGIVLMRWKQWQLLTFTNACRHASVAHSRQSVLPVPVGLSNKAFSD
jgi:hypothetical protein